MKGNQFLDQSSSSDDFFIAKNEPQTAGEFTGVWIPAEVMLADDLNATEKITYAVIAGFRKFFGSNKWLAQRLGVAERTAQDNVAKLVAKGYVRRKIVDESRRVLVAVRDFEDRPAQKTPAQNAVEPAQSKGAGEIDRQVVDDAKAPQNAGKMLSTRKTEVAEPVKNFGSEKINRQFEKWAELFGVPQKNSAQNRRACFNLLRAKDKGEEWLGKTMQLAKLAQGDRFAGRKVNANAGFADIQRNWADIWLWGKKQADQTQGATMQRADASDGFWDGNKKAWVHFDDGGLR